jgi:predicted membrane-bound spermidine synthase
MMRVWSTVLVYGVAFLSGAVLLGMEIVASRVLAPWFGNSVYVWGSLISVFLLALSLGYWLGGLLADRRPSLRTLAAVLAAAAAFTLPLPFVYLPVSRLIVALELEFRFSVLLACLLFFLAPAVLMGMVSPFVIKLSATGLDVIGRTAGNVYAVSTVGSITGALVVSFFLIPTLGTRAIVFVSGCTLLALAGVCLLGARAMAARSRA